jgi:hypothetical protein
MEFYHICVVFCLIGSFFLLFIGSLCLNQYPYLRLDCSARVREEPHPGWTCIYASGIYLSILLLMFLYKFYSKTQTLHYSDNSSASSDEDEPLVKYENKKFR